MLEIRLPSALSMDQPAWLAEGLAPMLKVPVGKKVTLDLTDIQRVSAFGLAALGARMTWLIRTRRMPSGSTIRRPESNRVGNDLLRMGLYRLIHEGSDQVYRATDPVYRPQELWLVDSMEELDVASQRLCGLLKLVVPAADENYLKLDQMIKALGQNVFSHSQSPSGLVLCAQGFPKSGVVEFAVADTGVGLAGGYKAAGADASLWGDDAQCIMAAITGLLNDGRPGGLGTLAATAKVNRGEMTVLSGGAWWCFRAGASSAGLCKAYPGTVVGLKLQLPTHVQPDDKPVVRTVVPDLLAK